ncbi:MAG: hypothetical protein QOK45_2282, partial [Mycobacterium sp.]|nr:hypothetical protein [Mycobacterium sp.]
IARVNTCLFASRSASLSDMSLPGLPVQ